VGGDWKSEDDVGLRMHVDYYDIRFKNRIDNLQAAGYNEFLALPMAAILGPQIVRLNPPAALVQQLVSSPNLVNFGANLSAIGAIIDSRDLNLSEVRTDGVDLSAADRFARGHMAVEPGVDATLVFRLKTRFTSSTPAAELLNTIYNPTRTRIRGHLAVSRKPLSVVAFVNFVNSYTNNTTAAPVKIASWTTFDLSATYSCEMCCAFLPGFSATLGVLNLLNRAPPYAENGSGFAVNYDGANSNPLGRFISLGVVTRW
jgi:iron complex outermembrane receptor protein